MWRVGKNLPSSTAARNHTKLITAFPMATTQLTKGTQLAKHNRQSTGPLQTHLERTNTLLSAVALLMMQQKISEAGNPSSHQQSTQQTPKQLFG